ncbi:MAG: hypothetical protein WKF37_19975 [Bryobacteraceae bacterium]
MIEFAYRTRIEKFPCLHYGRIKAIIKASCEDASGILRCIDHRLALIGVARQRFFAENVLAGVHCRNTDFGVGRRGGRNDYSVDIGTI